MMGFKAEKTLFMAVIFLSLLVKVLAINILNVELSSDAKAYWDMANSMLENGVMDDGQGNLAFYSSGYPLFLIPFIWLFGSSVKVALYLNVVLGLVSTSLVYLCAKVLLKDWKWALCAAVVWVCYPPNAIYSAYLAKENLMIPLLLLQIYLLLTFNNSSVKAVLIGMVFGIELLVGAAVILTIVPICYVLINIDLKKITTLVRSAKIIGGFVLGCAIFLTPWLTYTNAHLGSPTLNTNGGFNLYLGNNENAKVHFVSIMDTPMAADWHELRATAGEVDSFNQLKVIAIDYILSHPLETVVLSVRKVIYFWTPPYHSSKSGEQSNAETLTRIIWLLFYVVIMLFFLTSFLFIKSMSKQHLTLLLTIFLYCAIHGVAYVIFRYRLPVMPLVILMAASGAQFVYRYYQGNLTVNTKDRLN